MGSCREEVEKRLVADRAWFLGLVDLLKTRARTARDIAAQAKVFFVDPVQLEAEAVRRYWSKDPRMTCGLLAALEERFSCVPWEEDRLEIALRGLADEHELGAGRLIHPLRVALTGQTVSPGIFEVLRFLGRDRALVRIRDAVSRLNEMQT
jgi:glutamyl-tRNA synthetase